MSERTACSRWRRARHPPEAHRAPARLRHCLSPTEASAEVWGRTPERSALRASAASGGTCSLHYFADSLSEHAGKLVLRIARGRTANRLQLLPSSLGLDRAIRLSTGHVRCLCRLTGRGPHRPYRSSEWLDFLRRGKAFPRLKQLRFLSRLAPENRPPDQHPTAPQNPYPTRPDLEGTELALNFRSDTRPGAPRRLAVADRGRGRLGRVGSAFDCS